MKSCIITQSNYIPWKGYFDSIGNVDVFVVYDDMQYTRRDWRNRNRIKTPNGLKWLTIPVEVKGKYKQKINETVLADKTWNKKHLEVITQNYKNAKCFDEMRDWLRDLYLSCHSEFLTEINLHFIKRINTFLGIKTEIRLSSEFNLSEEKTNRLVDICKDLDATRYYTGPAAKNYMEEEIFMANGIEVNYWDYGGYPEYEQLNGDFEHGVSILDLIFNVGNEAANHLKFVKAHE